MMDLVSLVVILDFSVDDRFYFFIFFNIYLFMKDTERERRRHRQREKQAPCREPNAGLDPGCPGSRPGLKVALNPWATRAAHKMLLLIFTKYVIF